MLHITNGDATRLHATRLPGEVIVWRDFLHDGPTPANLELNAMSRIRSEYIHTMHAGLGVDQLSRDFEARDRVLGGFLSHEKVLLWFEADLYDQLQILQILDWFSMQERRGIPIEMICIGDYPGVEPFWGLGQLSAEQLATLYGTEITLTNEDLQLAANVWIAFCSPDPFDIEAFARVDLSPFVYLADALKRHLRQFPAVRNGLGLTEQLLLEGLSEGPTGLDKLFMEMQQREQRPFLGDAGFLDLYVRPLAFAKHPLVALEGGDWPDSLKFPYRSDDWNKRVRITDVGRAVLTGAVDHIRLNGMDRWRGGVHLEGHEVPWRWDESGQRLVKLQ